LGETAQHAELGLARPGRLGERRTGLDEQHRAQHLRAVDRDQQLTGIGASGDIGQHLGIGIAGSICPSASYAATVSSAIAA
jgi:hypothetical protein